MCYFEGHIRNLGKVSYKHLKKLTSRVVSPRTVEIWDVENKNKPNKFEALHGARHIVFQFPVDDQDHTKSTYKPLWKEWKMVISPLIKEATKSYNYKNGKTARIMLANVRPDGVINMHVDQNRSADVPHKIHVPIVTDELAEFYEKDSTYKLERGFAYEVNNKIPHGVHNKSTSERIHLIFDYYESV